MEPKSFVWKHFTKGPKANAQCNLCPRILVYKGSSTSGLVKHLVNIHHINAEGSNDSNNDDDEIEQPQPKRQRSIKEFLPSNKLDEVLAKMAAFDGISIRAITRSSFIRESLSLKGFQCPKSEATVMKSILDFYSYICQGEYGDRHY